MAQTSHGPFATRFIACAARFNDGDTSALLDVMAPNCTMDGSRGPVGSSAEEIVQRLTEARAAFGWQRHEVVWSAEDDTVATMLGTNTFADGSTRSVGGVFRLDDGKVVQIKSLGGLPD